MNRLIQIKETAMQSGLSEAGYLDTQDLSFYPELRDICATNVCGNYGASWACPPAVGTLEECRQRVLQYKKMLLFSKKYKLEDSFDFEGMHSALSDFKRVVDLFEKNIRAILTDYQILSNEGCGRCKTCAYPNGTCRFPNLLHHSIEGYGFHISELAQKAGVRYYNGNDTVTYFGGLLIP